MDSADPTQDELDAELKDLRAGLRAFGKRLALHVQGMDMPETPLEAERTARMVRATDQMLIQIYAPPAPPKPPRDTTRSAGSARGSSTQGSHTWNEDDDQDEAPAIPPSGGDLTGDELAMWRVVLERKLLDLARRKRAAVAAGTLQPPAQSRDDAVKADEHDEEEDNTGVTLPDTSRHVVPRSPAGPSISDPFPPRDPP